MRHGLLAALALAAGCGSADAERGGDEAYARGRYGQALAVYRDISSRSEPRVLAKIGAAAVRAGRLSEATDAYLQLAGEAPARVREAAAGLDGVARAAEQAGNRGALQEAVLGLQAIAPGGVPVRYALVLAQQPEAGADELVALLPAAIAAAPDQATVDSLLLRYGRALEATGGCGQALLPYRAVARRAPDSPLGREGRQRTAVCALTQGQRAQRSGRVEDAALWYAEASRVDSTSVTGRRALVSLGDLRLREGDTLAAAIAFQTAISASGQTRDSIAETARARLGRLGLVPSAGDTVRPDGP